MRSPKRILLTGIGGNTAQGVARSLLKFPEEFTVVGSDSDKYNCRFGFRYSSRVYLTPRAEEESYIDTVSKIIRKESIDVVIPSPEPEVRTISEHGDELDAKLLLPRPHVVRMTQDKWLTFQALKGKVPQPEARLLDRPDQIEEAFSQLQPPLWLRKRKGAGGSKALLVHNAEQTKFWVDYWKGYGEFMISEFLPGRNLSWIGLYKEGELITSGGYERIRYFMERISPTGVTGNVNVAKTINDDALNNAAEKALVAIDTEPNGVYTIDLKGDAEPIVTEFNSGRFHMSSYTYTVAGVNMPCLYVKLALGEAFESPARRNALRAEVITIRNTDNEPVFTNLEDLGKDVLTV